MGYKETQVLSQAVLKNLGLDFSRKRRKMHKNTLTKPFFFAQISEKQKTFIFHDNLDILAIMVGSNLVLKAQKSRIRAKLLAAL